MILSLATLETRPEASFEGGWGAVAPKEKEKKKKERKRKKEEKKRRKKKERKKGTMNNVKLLTYKVLLFPIFQ